MTMKTVRSCQLAASLNTWTGRSLMQPAPTLLLQLQHLLFRLPLQASTSAVALKMQ